MTLHTPLILSGLALVILTLLLAFWTSIERSRSRTIAYDAPLEPTSGMAKAQRAHGNAAEYSALLIGLFVLVGFAYQGRDLGITVTALVVAVTASRFLHALGFLICKTLERPHALKAIGAIVTYLGGLALAGMAIAKVL
ncbi:MAG: MAPEG family protein [Pseudomonadota bacterium]